MIAEVYTKGKTWIILHEQLKQSIKFFLTYRLRTNFHIFAFFHKVFHQKIIFLSNIFLSFGGHPKRLKYFRSKLTGTIIFVFTGYDFYDAMLRAGYTSTEVHFLPVFYPPTGWHFSKFLVKLKDCSVFYLPSNIPGYVNSSKI